MGHSHQETDLCGESVGPDTSFFKHQVPDKASVSSSLSIDFQDSHFVPEPADGNSSNSMSISLSHTTYTSQDQLSRSSYTEMVHQELVHHHLATAGPAGEATTNTSSALGRLVTTLTEWLVILQGVAEDRECDRPNANCRCSKAAKIHSELTVLAKKLNNAEQICERVGMIGEDVIDEISEDVHTIASLLRSEVSILIPTSMGRADPMVVEQARWLVQSSDTRNCASEAVEGVRSLVVRLLGVETCQNCPFKKISGNVVAGTHRSFADGSSSTETGAFNDFPDSSGHEYDHQQAAAGGDGDVDMDILNLVAGLCSGYPTVQTSNKQFQDDTEELREVGRQTVERSRKRKQAAPVRIPSPTLHNKARKVDSPDSTTSLAAPVEEDPNILGLLEKKKKGVKKDGLYKFVLWREALKEEKSKMAE